MPRFNRATNRLNDLPREPITTVLGTDANGGPIYDMPPIWRLFFEQFQLMLSTAGGIMWSIISKVGSRLEEIESRPHASLQDVHGLSTPNIDNIVAEDEEVLHLSLAQARAIGGEGDGDDQLLSWL